MPDQIANHCSNVAAVPEFAAAADRIHRCGLPSSPEWMKNAADVYGDSSLRTSFPSAAAIAKYRNDVDFYLRGVERVLLSPVEYASSRYQL